MSEHIEAKCSNCNHHKFDDHWGEYKCLLKKRVCKPSEKTMGCNKWEKLGTKIADPEPEIVVRSGATFTPYVSETGELSWTNNKGLINPKQVNITGPKGDKGDSPIKGIDYFTDAEKAEIISNVLASLPVYKGEVEAV